jgi:hypothetical protein
MRIQMRKCPFTGKLFDESKIGEYIWHLKVTRDAMREERELKRIKDTFKDWLKAEKKKIIHPDQIPEWFLANQQYLMDAHNAGCRSTHYHGFGRDKFYSTDKFTKVVWERAPVYSANVSNTHSCPDNGKQNFDGKLPGVPTGYPGWTGYIKGSLSRNKKHCGQYPYSELLNLVGIKTGSGGGGNENWGYDFRLWLADWPGLKEEVRAMEEREILRRLKGK